MYSRRESIALFCGIYEREETLQKFIRLGIPIFPFFWERNPISPKIPASARGVKLHPYIEDYVLDVRNIHPVLEIARERNLPLLIHTDDRRPSVSRGRLFAAIAAEYPDITLIMAHSGSYAPGKIDSPGSSWVRDSLVKELVSEAIEVASEYPNVYLEVSILASRTKAQLIAKEAPLERVLIGTDFPIYKPVFGSVVFQEDALVQAGLEIVQIKAIHQNAMHLFQMSQT
jgi:predicted TIM-barrel fold metal-dependent hydrolase